MRLAYSNHWIRLTLIVRHELLTIVKRVCLCVLISLEHKQGGSDAKREMIECDKIDTHASKDARH